MSDLHTDCLVIGSGAGGALTAALLAEAGREVILIEEGPRAPEGIATNSPEAMRLMYRNGGLSPMLGKPALAFVEGRCVGGSTEINSAFWHRVPEAILDEWTSEYAVEGLSRDGLDECFDELERDIPVSPLNTERVPRSSEVFKAGAERLGWTCVGVQRAQASDLGTSAYAAGAKRSMSTNYLPRFEAAGGRLIPNCKALRILVEGGRAVGAEIADCGLRIAEGLQQPNNPTTNNEQPRTKNQEPRTLRAANIFICGGAVQSAALLRQSGITRNVGNSLRLHPMLKVAAQFDNPMDSHEASLPVYQIKQFSPAMTLGGAVFTPGFLALTLSDNWMRNEAAMADWRSMALYYVGTRAQGRGRVRSVPFTHEAFTTFALAREDERVLNDGLLRLCEVLFAAGARRVYPGMRSRAVFTGMDDVRGFLQRPVRVADMSLSVLHVFGTCPMGEDLRRCAVDSFGRVHGVANLHVNDASILPTPTGVNPQGTIMAVAMRNTRRVLAHE